MTKQDAIKLIETTFNQKFDESNFLKFIKNFLNDTIEKENVYRGNYIKEAFREHIAQYKRIGKYIDPNADEVDILIVEVKDHSKLDKARTTLRNFVISHLDNFEKDYALVAFYAKSDDGADWRFSFVKLEYRTEVKEGKLKQRKELTPAKRYSFLVGVHEKSHTAKAQLLPYLQNVYNNPTVEQLEQAFSIETVTNEFFEQYKLLFGKLLEQFEKDTVLKAELVKNNVEISRFAKKLLGQIVFLYFLQKKGWMGVDKAANWGSGKKNFLQTLYTEAEQNNKNYFADFLQYLFYDALANPHDDEGVKDYYTKLRSRIPFLNGGLFAADYDWKNANISIPNELFRDDKNLKSGMGILDVFDRYNFTIKEDEPLEKEVAVDPEMLGKVFENMLEVTERKSKGAFYTPREIVHYMCQESLIHYLDNAINEVETKVSKADIEEFIRNGFFALENDQRVIRVGQETRDYPFQLPESIRQNANKLDELISHIKICDPAIGSGAFPVGLLHELVNAQLVLRQYLSTNYFKAKLKALGLSQPEYEQSPSKYIYRLKRHTIQESIYGVDIDASAIDVARLRLWLSMVVDEDDLDNIEALPNLDYKIVCGNSLIGLPENGIILRSDIQIEIEKLKEDFFAETDETYKKELRQKINLKIRELLNSAEQYIPYKIDFDFKLYFSEVWREKEGGFDIVIGNPPYISNWSQSKDNRPQVVLLEKIFKKYLTGHWDIFLCFIPKSIYLLKPNGICSFILPTSFYKEKHSTKVREYFIEELKVLELLDFEKEVVFSDVARQTGIFSVQKVKVKDNIITVKNGLNINERLVEQKFFKTLKSYTFKLNITAQDILVYNKITKGSFDLGIFVCINTGVVAHSKLGSPINFKKDDVVFNYYQEGFKPYIIGSNISRLKIDFKGDFLDYDSKQEFFHRPKYKILFESPKIVVRRISGKNNSIIASYDDEKYYSNDNLMHLIQWTNEVLSFQKPEKKWRIELDSELSLKFILSIISSEVINYFFSKFLSTDTLQGSYSSIYPEEIRQFPIKKLNVLEQRPFIIICDYLLFSNQKSSNKLINRFFDNLLNCCVFCIYFPTEIKAAGKDILKHLTDLESIDDSMSEEQKLAIIQQAFERLYDPNHPVRNAVETLDSVEEVRIIKEALKK